MVVGHPDLKDSDIADVFQKMNISPSNGIKQLEMIENLPKDSIDVKRDYRLHLSTTSD